MKLNQVTTPVEIEGAIGRPTTFSIAASKQAFKVLSSNLYNNKIRAIIRELSCNAYDAHVAAGKKDVPFEIHLPNQLEPTFEVKDQGTGLEYKVGGCSNCHGKGKLLVKNEVGEGILIEEEVTCSKCNGSGDYDAVKELYCTYFASNKSESNLFVGALGLGSKSPFCYTEGFTVTNCYNGITRIYACFINELGMPDVLLQEQRETPNDVNGLEVSFPVKSDDFWEFENQAKQALEFFNPLPKMNQDIDVDGKDYSFRNSQWGLRRNDPYGKPRAIQGMVQYNIGEIDASKLTGRQINIVNLPLDLFFEIGDLEVAASREALSNDETTVKNIIKAIDNVVVGLIKDVKEKVKVAKTPWEAKLMLFNLGNTPGIGPLINEAYARGEFDAVYTGFQLKQGNLTINQLSYPWIAISQFRSTWRKSTEAEKYLLTLTDDDLARKLEKDPARAAIDVAFEAKSDCVFIINDVGFGGEKYIHFFLKEAPDNKGSDKKTLAYLITRSNKTTPVNYIVTQAAKIIAEIGNPPVILLSELKKRYQIQAAKAPSPQVKRELFVFETNSYIRHQRKGYTVQGWRDAWTVMTGTQGEARRFFVNLERLEPTEGHFEHAESFQQFIRNIIHCKKFGITDKDKIYGIPKESPYLKDNDPAWTPLLPYIQSKLKEFMTPEVEMQLSLFLHNFEPNCSKVLYKIASTKPLKATSIIQEFSIKYVKAKNYSKDEIEALSAVLMKAQKLSFYEIKSAINFNDEWTKVVEVYPMLKYVDSYFYGDKTKRNEEILDYIKMVEERQSKSSLIQIVSSETLIPNQIN